MAIDWNGISNAATSVGAAIGVIGTTIGTIGGGSKPSPSLPPLIGTIPGNLPVYMEPTQKEKNAAAETLSRKETLGVTSKAGWLIPALAGAGLVLLAFVALRR